MIKVTAISDTHTYHKKIIIESTDILIHAGDYSSIGRIHECREFFKWFQEQPAKHKIFIDGNHDALSSENPDLFKAILSDYPDLKYLSHDGIEVEGIKIWGYPTTPTFGNWWHMADRGSINMKSNLHKIPGQNEHDAIDILISHGPPYEILDKTVRGLTVGCQDLLEELDRIKPQYCIIGHIHEDHGQKEVNGIKYLNVSILDEYYKVKHKPTQFEIDITKKTK
jgi:Icc-related predicted phosphoesterase